MSRFILIGHPVAHSVSPAIHRAAYESLGQPHDYQVVDAPDEQDVRREVQALRDGTIAGANVTVPHKRLALTLADHLHVSAEQIGAANVLSVNEAGAVVASNTDALGLAKVLGELVRGGTRALVIGNGGAALACVVACQQLGFAEVLVTARAFDARRDPGAWAHAKDFERLGALPVAWLASNATSLARVAGVELVLQATSAGMHGADAGEGLAQLVPWSALASGSVAYDLVYNPALTPFLREAEARGLRAEGGLSMLVAQAQLAIELWLGVLPPAEPLLAAAKLALRGRS